MQARNKSAHERAPGQGRGTVRRVAPGTFSGSAPDRDSPPREPDRPALVMLLAPILGLAIWAAILFLLVVRLF